MKRHPKANKSKKFFIAICRLKKLNGHQKKQALGMASSNFVRQFCTHVKKLKHRRLSAVQRKQLRKHTQDLRKLTNKKTSIVTKRSILTKRGGLLPLLIPLIASVAAPVVGSVVSKVASKIF